MYSRGDLDGGYGRHDEYDNGFRNDSYADEEYGVGGGRGGAPRGRMGGRGVSDADTHLLSREVCHQAEVLHIYQVR